MKLEMKWMGFSQLSNLTQKFLWFTCPLWFLLRTTPNVRDELAILYAEEVIAVLPQHVINNCTGCAFGYDKNTNASEHDVCTLPPKEARESVYDTDFEYSR